MLELWLRTTGVQVANRFKSWLKDEKGDTNFISIIIILGIVIIVAGVFIGFKDQIVSEVQGIVGGFTLEGDGAK